jgi:hypothetical protein
MLVVLLPHLQQRIMNVSSVITTFTRVGLSMLVELLPHLQQSSSSRQEEWKNWGVGSLCIRILGLLELLDLLGLLGLLEILGLLGLLGLLGY